MKEIKFAKVNANLVSHPMIRDLFALARPLILDETQTKTLTTSDAYNLDVFDAIGALTQSFDLLELSRSFATLPPSANYLKGLKINRHDWLEYHISTFLITFVTIGDEAVSLVNDVLRLGIYPPRYCHADAVKSNKWVKDTSIPARLDAIRKLIKPHKENRNRLVHGGKIPSLSSLVKSGNLDQLKKISFALQHSPEAFPQTMHTKLDEAYVKALTQIDKTLDEEATQLKTSVWHLLTDLHKFYSAWLSILSSNIVSEIPKD